MFKIVSFVLFMLLITGVSASDLRAPEITGYDVLGFDPFVITEDGAIHAGDGAVTGWIHGNTVYDAQWNIKYYIKGNRVYRVKLEG
jgi:hypothetical protein